MPAAVRGSRSDLPGLQAERTSLAWERTALALFGNGALLVLRHLRGTDPTALLLGVSALVLAVVCAVLGLRRAARIRSTGGPVPVARAQLMILASAVLIFGIAAAGVLVTGNLPGRS